MDQKKQAEDSLHKRHLDVRDILEAGGEPYSIIMKTVLALKSTESLVLHVPFKPKPLISQLHRMGYSTKLKHEGVDHFTVLIKMLSAE